MAFFDEIRDGKAYKYLVNGQWKASGSNNRIKLFSPLYDEHFAEIQSVTRQEIDEVMEAALQAQQKWKDTPLHERAELLHKAAALLVENKDEIVKVLVHEVGKPRKSAEDEVLRSADLINYTAEEGIRIHGELLYSDSFPGNKRNKYALVGRVPLGVVLAIPPFNYPINLAASKVAPALVAGNAVVLKTPTQGAVSALHFVQAFHKAGFPPGLINAVTGKGSEIGDYLVEHPRVSMITFTGSTQTGLNIAKKAGMKPLQLELGGKDASIVFEDADLDEAAKNIVSGAFSFSGQRCTAVKRVLVLDSIADQLRDKIIAEVKKLKVGSPDENADICPLIDKNAADFVEGLIKDAEKKGAKLCTPFKRENNTISPVVVDNVTEEMQLAWEEPFGPVLPLIRVKSVDDAIRIANGSEYGLQAAIFTRDIKKALEISRKIDVGTVQINGKTARGPDHFPFLGTKSSGIGTQGVRYSIEAMTRTKSLVINL
jgi:glyceraldehyde-3-phosphate dehydrogenase (NADP+)